MSTENVAKLERAPGEAPTPEQLELDLELIPTPRPPGQLALDLEQLCMEVADFQAALRARLSRLGRE